MVKNILKRFTSIMLTAVMVLLMLPIGLITANADAVSGITVADLSTDYSGDGTWAGNGNTINGSIAPKESSGCAGTSYSQQTATLTLKNTNKRFLITEFSSLSLLHLNLPFLRAEKAFPCQSTTLHPFADLYFYSYVISFNLYC